MSDTVIAIHRPLELRIELLELDENFCGDGAFRAEVVFAKNGYGYTVGSSSTVWFYRKTWLKFMQQMREISIDSSHTPAELVDLDGELTIQIERQNATADGKSRVRHSCVAATTAYARIRCNVYNCICYVLDACLHRHNKTNRERLPQNERFVFRVTHMPFVGHDLQATFQYVEETDVDVFTAFRSAFENFFLWRGE
ncbi:MAG: hypothetical protein ACRC46_13270 [Thermoguttaceae bacterium]